MMASLCSGQQVILDDLVGEHVTIELVNKERHENILVKDIDPYSMTFILEFEDRERFIQIKRIFYIDKMKESNVETRTKQYNTGIIS